MQKLSLYFGKKLLPFTSAGILLLATSSALAQTNAPTLSVVTPQEGQTIYGNKVPILLAVENFEIMDYQINKVKDPGQGHIHLWLDDANPTPESAVKLTKDEFTFNDVPEGNHTLRAELVFSDHSSLTPPQVLTVNFKNEPIPAASPTADSGFDRNTAVVIFVVVALVIAAAWWYTKEEDEGPEKESKGSKTKTKKRKTPRRRSK